MKYDADADDLANIDALAAVIEDMLFLVPQGRRMEVLKLAIEKEQKEATEREARGTPYRIMTAADFCENDPELMHWNAIMRLKSLMIQVFSREITNNNSSKDAAKILFVVHRHGTGSRLLSDYLDDLPRGDR